MAVFGISAFLDRPDSGFNPLSVFVMSLLIYEVKQLALIYILLYLS